MQDAHKKLETEIAAEIIAKFASDEVKQLLADTKAASEADTGTFEVVITTENLDRYNEVIKLDGWMLDHYRKNPVVLWGHDHSRLIGMATSVDVKDGKIVAKGKFAPTEEGQEKRKLYEAGFLRATSVGFIEHEREGNIITKAELIEFSFVSVPANPYALSLAMERGIAINELVTKGIMFVEKGEEGASAELQPTAAPEPVPQAAADAQERSFSTKQLGPVIESLRAALVALEALGKSEEPEGDEDEGTEETDEQKQLREFNEKRKLLQLASTVLGDVLAESRQAIEARKSAA